MQTVATWTFVVQLDSRGDVVTQWAVEPNPEYHEPFAEEGIAQVGFTTGPLHEAIVEAYDGAGLICPLVLDPDLLKLNGSHG